MLFWILSILFKVDNAFAADIKIDVNTFPDTYIMSCANMKDTNKDGYLQKVEIKAVKKLTLKKFIGDYVYGSDGDADGLSNWTDYKQEDCYIDLSGIEIFENLESLKLDYSGARTKTETYVVKVNNFDKIYKLKKLKKLKKLSINEGDLALIDASKLQGLQELALRELSIKKVVFGENNRLRKLSITELKKLKSIDLSKLKKLSNLQLQFSHIKKLNLKNNKELKILNIDRCPNIKSVNLSKNTKMKKCYFQGYVKNVYLAKNNQISFFRWVGCNNKKIKTENLNPKTLKTLILYESKFKKLDIRKYKKLKVLGVEDNVKIISTKQQKKQLQI